MVPVRADGCDEIFLFLIQRFFAPTVSDWADEYITDLIIFIRIHHNFNTKQNWSSFKSCVRCEEVQNCDVAGIVPTKSLFLILFILWTVQGRSRPAHSYNWLQYLVPFLSWNKTAHSFKQIILQTASLSIMASAKIPAQSVQKRFCRLSYVPLWSGLFYCICNHAVGVACWLQPFTF